MGVLDTTADDSGGGRRRATNKTLLLLLLAAAAAAAATYCTTATVLGGPEDGAAAPETSITLAGSLRTGSGQASFGMAGAAAAVCGLVWAKGVERVSKSVLSQLGCRSCTDAYVRRRGNSRMGAHGSAETLGRCGREARAADRALQLRCDWPGMEARSLRLWMASFTQHQRCASPHLT